MSDLETRFHETWLGMVQPVEGLVVSVPVLVDAQCMHRHQPSFQQTFLDVCPPVQALPANAPKDAPVGERRIGNLAGFLETVLEWKPELYDVGDALPDDLSLYVPEGKQTLRPTLGLKHQGQAATSEAKETSSDTPAAKAGSQYVALLWEVPDGLDLDKPETETGPWEYPVAAKFDRLLRQCRVPIGILTNRRELRLFYAPHGESSGVIRFKVDDMASVGGRPILDAFVMLLSAHRFFGALAERQLPAILAESRKRQVNVTNQLADQVFDALQILLRGFEAAGEHDVNYRALLRDALERGDDHLYGGLLTVLLRLVFVLYAEDRGLLPVETKFYAENFSLLALFDELQQDHGAFPDSMSRRYGAWPRLLSLFRAIFLGCEHGDLKMPARRGELFDPHLFPFLEGWGPAGSAPITMAENRAEVAVPGVDDETVFRVLQKLLLLEGQRLSYRALDVEQIGSVYEALMGYHVQRVESPSVCLKPDRAKAVWVSAVDALAQKKAQRGKWFKEDVGLTKGHAEKIAKALAEAKNETAGLEILEGYRVKHTETAAPGRLVIQPGSERKRTSSHYTPRSLSAPIVEKTLAPLIKVMGDEPSSERLLNLKVCDPAMGSGAFLVEACRYLADQVVAAWTRENRLDKIADEHEDVVNHARRLVAQRCLYGVDKNKFAVNLAKLSLWLVTLAKDEPFTFVDHALRHGDSLVGLDFEQIKSFHWQPSKQLELCRGALEAALDEAISLRQQILDLATHADELSSKEKYRLLQDAEDSLEPVRLIGDLVIGAFFASTKDHDRQKERDRLLQEVTMWLESGGPPSHGLKTMQAEIRGRIPVFHWMVEYPEVFYSERPDPLEHDKINRVAAMDSFAGNPPFLRGGEVSGLLGDEYRDWLQAVHPGAHGNSDLVAHFFRRADVLAGAHGTIGFLATNTISQGDTRTTGLKYLVDQGLAIYHSTRDIPWAGGAAVSVSVVHLAKGSACSAEKTPFLDGVSVPAINSRLRGYPERPEPAELASNRGLVSQGVHIYGNGFLVAPEERQQLIDQSPHNEDRLRPYIGGGEVASNPGQVFDRYVIDFRGMDLDEAANWPSLLEIVRERVKGPRDDMRPTEINRRMQQLWWRYWAERSEFFAGMRGHKSCIVTPQTSKYYLFSMQPLDRVFAQTLYVFAFNTFDYFAVLQSRVHGLWCKHLCSSMETRLRYLPTQAFVQFPFPLPSPAGKDELVQLGELMHRSRVEVMGSRGLGLTELYNLLGDQQCNDQDVESLRTLHTQIDVAILAAYGWSDIDVPPFHRAVSSDFDPGLEVFQDEVVDRLFVLNAERAKEEGLAGRSTKNAKGKPKGNAKRKKASDSKQLGLLDGGSE